MRDTRLFEKVSLDVGTRDVANVVELDANEFTET